MDWAILSVAPEDGTSKGWLEAKAALPDFAEATKQAGAGP
jgi:hypothetical protein